MAAHRPPCRRIFVQRMADGSFVTWGRHATVQGIRGEGPAGLYRGEDAKILELVLRHSPQPFLRGSPRER